MNDDRWDKFMDEAIEPKKRRNATWLSVFWLSLIFLGCWALFSAVLLAGYWILQRPILFGLVLVAALIIYLVTK